MSHSVLAALPATRRRPPPALLVLAGVLLLSLIGRLVFTIAEPPFDGSIDYDDLRALDGVYWPLNIWLGGPAYLLSFVTTAVSLALLGRGRGSVPALVGGVLVGLGGTVFSLAITAEALPFAWATDPAVFGEAEGRALVEVFNGADGQLLPAILGGQVVIGLGALIGLVGVLLSRTTPRWFPVAGLVFVPVSQLVPLSALGPVAMIGDYVVQLALLGGFGWFALRRSASSAQSSGTHSPAPS